MSRVIRKSRQRASAEAASLLSSVFSGELLAPSKCLWIVSPWISDIPVIDNTAGSFQPLQAFGPRQIRLSEVLAVLAGEGTTVVVGTTTAESNQLFKSRVKTAFRDRGLRDHLKINVDASNELHEKAITADDYVITGSMNITNNGVFVREEFIEFRRDSEFVARARMDSFERFGGKL